MRRVLLAMTCALTLAMATSSVSAHVLDDDPGLPATVLVSRCDVSRSDVVTCWTEYVWV